MKGYFLAVLLAFSFSALHAQQSNTDQQCSKGETKKQCQQIKVDALFAQLDANAESVAIKEFPSFDIHSYCSRVVASIHDPVDGVLDACLQQENLSKNNLEAHWVAMPIDTRQECLAESYEESKTAPSGWDYELMDAVCERLLNVTW